MNGLVTTLTAAENSKHRKLKARSTYFSELFSKVLSPSRAEIKQELEAVLQLLTPIQHRYSQYRGRKTKLKKHTLTINCVCFRCQSQRSMNRRLLDGY